MGLMRTEGPVLTVDFARSPEKFLDWVGILTFTVSKRSAATSWLPRNFDKAEDWQSILILASLSLGSGMTLDLFFSHESELMARFEFHTTAPKLVILLSCQEEDRMRRKEPALSRTETKRTFQDLFHWSSCNIKAPGATLQSTPAVGPISASWFYVNGCPAPLPGASCFHAVLSSLDSILSPSMIMLLLSGVSAVWLHILTSHFSPSPLDLAPLLSSTHLPFLIF